MAVASEAAAPSCTLKFKVGTSTKLYSASVFVQYQNAPGDFPGSNEQVNCSALNGHIVAFGDADTAITKTLSITVAGTPNPISGPKEVAQCTFVPTSRFPVVGDFDLSLQGGANTSFQPTNPQFTISSLVCSGTISTTTTTTTTTSSTTTTTTLPAVVCGDGNGDGKFTTADALAVLKAAVGQRSCQLCACDVDSTGSISTVDALKVLKKSVGVDITLSCAACAS